MCVCKPRNLSITHNRGSDPWFNKPFGIEKKVYGVPMTLGYYEIMHIAPGGHSHAGARFHIKSMGAAKYRRRLAEL